MYTFSSIEKEEYSKMYDFLKSKKINVKSTGKMDASKISLGEDVDHNLEKVRRTYLPNFLSTESWHEFLDMFYRRETTYLSVIHLLWAGFY